MIRELNGWSVTLGLSRDALMPVDRAGAALLYLELLTSMAAMPREATCNQEGYPPGVNAHSSDKTPPGRPTI